MGGKITVQSEPGKGSTFSVRLSFALATDVGRASARHDGDGVGLKPDLQNPDLVAGLHCLVVGGTESLSNDLAAYLVHDGAMVERVADLAAVKGWVASSPPGLRIVVIDTAGSKPPLDGLRAAARAQPEQQTRFVIIGRGQRREPRLEDADLVLVDGNVLARKTLLKAVAIAAGRAKAPERENTPGEAKAILAPLSREEACRRGRLILVAEDNEINQKVIQQQLTLLGQTADIANNGREALEQWQGGGYGLLITDLHMPEMDGYELTETIRTAETVANKTSKSRKPIIAFTANALKGEAEHCLSVGMDDYLSKPVQLVNLKAMLEKWLPVVASVPDVGRDSACVVGASAPYNHGGVNSVQPKVGNGLPTFGVPLAGVSRQIGLKPDLQSEPPDMGTPVAVDVNVLKKLVGDDEEIIRDFLHDFRLSAAKIAVELRAACAAEKAAEAGALAHKLKSSARSVGALALGELCAEMEKSGKADDMAALAALLPRFEHELACVKDFLAVYGT
jgi:CheY-like chemotaxis protein/HPt (histidine-containing phosphotransfer) domain-containing protein